MELNRGRFMLNTLRWIKNPGAAFLIIFAVIVSVSIAIAPSAEGTLYKWKDETGGIHFTDDPSKIPRQFRGKTKKIESRVPERPPPPKAQTRDFEHVIPLTAKRNQFFVSVLLNGKVKVELLLDTGASLIVLSDEIGKQLGYTLYESMPQIKTETAGGVVWSPLVTLKNVRVGEAEVEDLDAVINDKMEGIDGLLGMTFLNQFKMTLDHLNSRMVLKPLGDASAVLYDGQTERWWRKKFSDYLANINYHEKLTRDLEKKGHIKAFNVEKVVRHFQELYRKLKTRASLAGVPAKLQSGE